MNGDVTVAGALKAEPGANGEVAEIKTNSEELTGLSGASATSTGLIPAGAFLLGVVGRVTTLIEGATTFDVGDGSDVDIYGAGIGLSAGTTFDIDDYTAQPNSFWPSAGDVVLTANVSNFTAGAVRLTAIYIDLTPPTS